MSCPCLITVEFMTRIGAVSAAQAHLKKPSERTEADERLHISEEDKWFRPFIVEHFPLLAAVYDEDHRVFLRELDTHGRIVSVERMLRHAAMEDWMTVKLIEMGY